MEAYNAEMVTRMLTDESSSTKETVARAHPTTLTPPSSVDRKGHAELLRRFDVLEQDEDKGGRRITQSGQRDLDRIAQTTLEAEEEEDDE
ncbi:hypothetical protein SNOG_00553 [Parastagonospora nodorum SN15]|uniref:40S ribosomal protein S19 n=1 Tax=Phaeosphaeria nodorum (strain SN15 / ATCC MYA-4574 / FGSC 10173) TaxID=321614 RepID=Q0V611_PHANO|nr:hypothetical protein SNOG_00553 [Parastagonospora nodorum SN15]EAT92048.2 hypothetical protein SNOG_00553 [Parastagonospora nodorum SN15]